MSLQRKSLIAFVAVLVATIAIIATVMSTVVPNRIQNIEKQDTGSELALVGDLIKNRAGQIASVCRDWASWDDTYAFIQDRNQDYVTSNLIPDTLVTLDINYIVYYDDTDEEVLNIGYDFTTETEAPLPGSYREYLGTILAQKAPDDRLKGLAVIEDTAVLLAIYPILDSLELETPRGALVFARVMDEQLVEDIGGLVATELTLYPYDSEDLPEEILEVKQKIDGVPVYTWIVDSNEMDGIIVMNDIEEQPALIIKGSMERLFFPSIYSLMLTVMLGLIAILLAVTITAALHMRRWVLRPLGELSENIRQMSITAALDERLPVRGQDEVSLVAGGINELLDTLQKTRDALIDSNEQYRDLFENAHDLIQSVDENSRFLYTNPAWRKTLGYSQQEIAKLSLFDIIHPDSLAHCREVFQQVIAGEPVNSIEAAFIAKDGHKIWVVGSASCRFIEGKPTNTRGIFHDVTDVRNALSDLEEAYEQEKKLSENLQEEIQRRVDIVRIITHELKNSLTSLMASSEMLMEVSAEEPEPLKSLTKNVNRSTSHLYKRVREMLDMARLEMGTLNIEMEPVSPDKILNHIAQDIRPLAESRGQTIVLQIPEPLHLILADPERLWQVCINLLDNASRHTPAGGTITIGAVEEDSFLKIFVKDTGKGIDKEAMKHLFDSYGKFDKRTGNLSGLGLGLSLCRSFVGLHGGKIWVESEPGAGSTFYFTIPLYREERQDNSASR